MPQIHGRFIEPFVGSGVVSLNVPFDEIIIADVNTGLIAAWQGLQMQKERFIAHCKSYFTPEENTAERYYKNREEFNSLPYRPEYAGPLFIYLNRHCFNGICRFNSRGEFNVPFGKYKKPYFPEMELRHAAGAASRMKIFNQGFVDTMKMAKDGDVIYCDPPYLPISNTSNFTSYSPNGFSLEMQVELVHCARWAQDQGATVIISNNAVPNSKVLYADATETHYVDVRKSVSCKADGRKKQGEIIAVYRP